MEERKNNTGLVVLIIVLVMLVLGMGAFIIYDKVINKTNEPNAEENNNQTNDTEEKDELKEISINDSLVSDLVYPTHNRTNLMLPAWEYKNIKVNDLSRDVKMWTAVHISNPVSEDETIEYSATEIEKKYYNVFGPDSEYVNKDIENDYCGMPIRYYDNARNIYYKDNVGCGGDLRGEWYYSTRLYKAEKTGDYIYTYFYVQPYFIDDGEYDVVFLFDRASELVAYDANDRVTGYVQEVDYNNRENIIESMMDKGEVDTYKWTFKKQSDGKYYFYSGAWEN